MSNSALARLGAGAVFALGGAAALASVALAADWPRFRGPALSGISSETGLLSAWPEAGPEVAWRVPVGDGYSGVSVADGRLYTMYDVAGAEHVVCHDAASGKELWRSRTDGSYESDQGNGPRSTPAVDGDLVYALGAQGKLVALAAETGKLVWKRDLVAEYKAEPPTWGVSTEPLVHGRLVMVNAGGKNGGSILAFDKKSGDLAWKSGDDGAGYSSPLPVQIDGTEQVLFFTAKALVSVSPKDGKALWRVPWETSYDVNAATPIFVPPNRVFVSSGYSTGSALLRVSMAEAKGKDSVGPSIHEVWKSRELKNKFSSSIVIDKFVYGFDDRVFKCLNVLTGEEQWKQSGLGHGSLTYADGKLFVLSEQGRLVLVEATPEAYRELASAEVLKGRCWTVPTLAGGRLYLRNQKELVCLKVAS